MERVPGRRAMGSASRLTPDQLRQLLAETRAGTFRTYHEVRHLVAETFGITYSYSGMWSVLTRLG